MTVERYLLCTQQKWGEIVYEEVKALRRSSEDWTLLSLPEAEAKTFDLAWLAKNARPRVIFFVHWSTFVSAAVLNIAECVNFHCTMLPYGRGGHPIENLILRGHTETAITAHRMTREVDAGPIYGCGGPISLAGTKPQILARFIPYCVVLTRAIVEHPERQPTPQVGDVVRFSRLSQAEYEALWASRWVM